MRKVLISTYWNVKNTELSLRHCIDLVLISTYWNVKPVNIPENNRKRRVLISTYWNVKDTESDSDNRPQERFNLNLLECKVPPRTGIQSGSVVLISTYWNVKLCSSVKLLSFYRF